MVNSFSLGQFRQHDLQTSNEEATGKLQILISQKFLRNKCRRVTLKCLANDTQQKQSWHATMESDDISNVLFEFSMISLSVFPQNTLCCRQQQMLNTSKILALYDLPKKICNRVEN